MSELRQDRTTGRWVIIAPKRGLRPGDQPLDMRGAIARPRRESFDLNCPFCPGHESWLPGIIAEMSSAAPLHWRVRVVPNKYPALRSDAEFKPDRQGEARAGYGYHEVIIESPQHDADLVSMTDAEIEAVVSAYRNRASALLDQPGIEAVVLFRNHGSRGGASLAHPHSQVLAIGMLPPLVDLLATWGQLYHSTHRRCPTCDEVAIECDKEIRVVERTENFVALVPFAAEHPCEVWILPLRHQASFVDIDDAGIGEFARLLRRTLARIRHAHDDPAYNFVIDSAGRRHRHSSFVHWRLRIAPDLATWGGFELGAGMAINPSSPNQDAAILRAVGAGCEVDREDRDNRG